MSEVKKNIINKIKQIVCKIKKLDDTFDEKKVISYKNIIDNLQEIDNEIDNMLSGFIYDPEYEETIKSREELQKYATMIYILKNFN